MYWFAVWGSRYEVDEWSDTDGGSSAVIKQNTTSSCHLTPSSLISSHRHHRPGGKPWKSWSCLEISGGERETENCGVSVQRGVTLGTNQWCYDVREDLATLTTLERGCCCNTTTRRTTKYWEQWNLETPRPDHQLTSSNTALDWPTSVVSLCWEEMPGWAGGAGLRGPISRAVPGPSQTRPTFMTQNISKKLVRFSTRNFVLDFTT